MLASTPFIYFYRKIVFENIRVIQELNKDPLTGLINRHAFYPEFIDHLNKLQDEEKSFALLMIDIDDFKHINDCHGHLVGDQVIKHASSIISTHIRPKELACRFGGEEFLVFWEDISLIEANILSQKMLDAFDSKLVYKDIEILITASIGMIFTNSTTIDSEDLISIADQKMYDAKSNGKNQLAHKIINDPTT